jgi:hypothetical protein
MSHFIKKGMILTAFLIAAAVPSQAYVYVVDGALNDWGVSPFVNWTPSASPTIDWAGGPGETDRGGPGNTRDLGSFGGEQFDVEAFYFDDTQDALKFALVTSFPQGGVTEDGIDFRTGDIAIGLNGSSVYTLGVKTTGADFGKLYLNPTWSLPNGNVGFPENGFSEFTGGTYLGNTSLVYTNLGIDDNGYPNYVVEGSISKSLLPFLAAGDQVELKYAMSCGNDDITINGTVDNPVPEPASLALFGLGTLGLGFFKRKFIA